MLGFSDSAITLMEFLQRLDERYNCKYLQVHPDLIDKIWEEYDRSQTENSGEDSRPLSREVVETAFCFLDSLPIETAVPDVFAEQDGNLALTWELDPSWTLFLSIGPNSKCYWAAIFGVEEVRGAFTFYGKPTNSLLVAIARFAS